MPSAFISSTGKDLADHRAAVIEICNRSGVVPIAMEFFESMGAGAVEGSKRKLREANVYIGIVAHRYGYVEPGQEKSVTEIEFDHAGELGLERLCFVVQPGLPWPTDAIDFENHGRLERFVERMKTSVILSTFTTLDDLRVHVQQALHEWLRHTGVTPAEPRAAGGEHVVPPPPPLMVGREADLRELKDRIARQGAVTIVRGWPGVGKTTVVNAIAHDPEVAERFPGGVYWIFLGEKGSAAAQLATLCRQLGAGKGPAGGLAELIPRARAVLERKRALLVVDDAWAADDAAPFKQVLGPLCALLVTTRFEDVARALADLPAEQIFRLGVLSDERGLELLRRLAPSVVRGEPLRSQELVRDLEGLPLAIRVAGRLLEAEAALGMDVTPLMDELRDSHRLLDARAPDDRFDPHTGTTPTVQLLLKSSSDRLSTEVRERFALLGAFAPKPATFDAGALKFVWETEDSFPTVRELVDRGLLEPVVSTGRFQMHALLVKHARSLLDD